MYAYTGVLSALMLRDRTGVGSRVDVSMLESLVEWMGFPLYYAYQGATPPPRAGAAHATIYPYGPFAAGDGRTVMLGLQNEREWQAFCDKVLQQPELARDERFSANSKRTENRAELRAIIVAAFSALSADEVIARLDAGADRQRPRQRHGRRLGASAAEGAPALDRRRQPERQPPGAAAAGPEQRVHTAHGPGAGARRAHRAAARRAGLRRRRCPAPARARRRVNRPLQPTARVA